MGLQGHLNDVASDSIPLYLVALLAVFFNHLRSLFRFGSSDSHQSHPASFLGTGLAGLVVLSEQLSLNRYLSYSYSSDPSSGKASAPECVFCLNALRSGDRVRKLSCCHVFHKDCLDGWLDQLKFSCPLCRSSVVGAGDSHDIASNRIGGELIQWFAAR